MTTTLLVRCDLVISQNDRAQEAGLMPKSAMNTRSPRVRNEYHGAMSSNRLLKDRSTVHDGVLGLLDLQTDVVLSLAIQDDPDARTRIGAVTANPQAYDGCIA
jgi:hypothetical protein